MYDAYLVKIKEGVARYVCMGLQQVKGQKETLYSEYLIFFADFEEANQHKIIITFPKEYKKI